MPSYHLVGCVGNVGVPYHERGVHQLAYFAGCGMPHSVLQLWSRLHCRECRKQYHFRHFCERITDRSQISFPAASVTSISSNIVRIAIFLRRIAASRLITTLRNFSYVCLPSSPSLPSLIKSIPRSLASGTAALVVSPHPSRRSSRFEVVIRFVAPVVVQLKGRSIYHPYRAFVSFNY